MNKNYLLIGAGLLALGIGLFLGYKLINQGSAMRKFSAGGPIAMELDDVGFSAANLPPRYCPDIEELQKTDLKWTTRDGKWENYTPSLGTKVLNFIGAQWLGIKVGKIICLYQTDEEISFPLALEQTKAQLILEPQGGGWSSLIDNHRLCKSSSVADCPYTVEPPRSTDNIYDEIKYAPKSNN